MLRAGIDLSAMPQPVDAAPDESAPAESVTAASTMAPSEAAEVLDVSAGTLTAGPTADGGQQREVGRGSGQGVAIARAAVEKRGGALSLETTLGSGTTFTIRLPIGGAQAA
jgi:hypothetical protein